MAFADNEIRHQLKNRIIAGVTGSTKFHTYQDSDTDTEGMINIARTKCGPLPCGCKLHIIPKGGCPIMSQHVMTMRNKVQKYNQRYAMYKCIKTNRMLSVLNLMLLVLLIILVYVLCFQVGKQIK